MVGEIFTTLYEYNDSLCSIQFQSNGDFASGCNNMRLLSKYETEISKLNNLYGLSVGLTGWISLHVKMNEPDYDITLNNNQSVFCISSSCYLYKDKDELASDMKSEFQETVNKLGCSGFFNWNSELNTNVSGTYYGDSEVCHIECSNYSSIHCSGINQETGTTSTN